MKRLISLALVFSLVEVEAHAVSIGYVFLFPSVQNSNYDMSCSTIGEETNLSNLLNQTRDYQCGWLRIYIPEMWGVVDEYDGHRNLLSRKYRRIQ